MMVLLDHLTFMDELNRELARVSALYNRELACKISVISYLDGQPSMEFYRASIKINDGDKDKWPTILVVALPTSLSKIQIIKTILATAEENIR
jgi:hypothetical protein